MASFQDLMRSSDGNEDAFTVVPGLSPSEVDDSPTFSMDVEPHLQEDIYKNAKEQFLKASISAASKPLKRMKRVHNAPPSPIQLENIGVVVQNQDLLLESAKACRTNPAELKVDLNLNKFKQKNHGSRRSRKFVPEEEKTPEYWAKRAKNTEAVRKFRDKKCIKNNEQSQRLIYLEEKYEELQKKYVKLKNVVKSKKLMAEVTP